MRIAETVSSSYSLNESLFPAWTVCTLSTQGQTVYLHLIHRQKSMLFQKCWPVKFKATFPTQSPSKYWFKHNKISKIKASLNHSQAFSRFQTGMPECMRGSRNGKAFERGAFISALGTFRAWRGKHSQVLREALAVGHPSASHGSLVAGPCLLMSDLAWSRCSALLAELLKNMAPGVWRDFPASHSPKN